MFATPPSAVAAGPTIVASSAGASGGDTILVTLDGWGPGAVTVTVCGNLAARGTQDCDLLHARGVGINNSGPTLAELVVALPPAPCPCIVRAATTTNDVVSSTPIDIVGMPMAPVVYPVVVTTAPLSAEVHEEPIPWDVVILAAALAGSGLLLLVAWWRARRRRDRAESYPGGRERGRRASRCVNSGGRFGKRWVNGRQTLAESPFQHLKRSLAPVSVRSDAHWERRNGAHLDPRRGRWGDGRPHSPSHCRVRWIFR